MSLARRLAVAMLGRALAATPTVAAERKPKPTHKPAQAEKAPAAPEAPADTTPPYEAQLMRLSELMGALAYLRDLCGDGDGAEYRAKMASLLDAEAGAPERREKLAGAYNRGYRGYETTYRVCTPNARTTIARFVEEGGRLARDIAYRYGGT